MAENALQEVPGAEIPSVPEVELAELSQEIKPIEESAEMVAADGAVSHGHTSEKMQNQTFSVHAMSQAVLEESWEDTLFDEVQQTCHSEAMETLPKNASDSAIVSDAPAKAKRLPKASGARRLAGPGKGRNSARNLVTSPEEERRFEIAMSSQTLEELLAADESGEQTEVAEPIDFESDELNQTMSEMRTSVNVSEEELGEAGIVQGTESGVSELDAEDFEKNSSKKSQMEFFEFEIEDMELFQQKQEEAQHEESVSEETAEETAETKSEGETLENEASEENQSTSESSEMSDSEEAIFTVESTSCLSTSGMEEDFSESSVGEETVGAEEAESETVFMEVREPSSSVTSEVVTAEAEISEAEVSEAGNFETEVCETETLVLENEASVLAEEAGISPSESVSGMSSIYRSTFKNRKDVRLIHDSKVEAAISASPAKRTVAYAAVCVSYEQKKSVINGRNAVVRGQNGTSGTQAAAGEEKEEEGDVELEFLLLPPEEFESKSIQELQNSAPVSQVSQVPQTTSESLDSHGSQDLQTSTAPKMLTEAGMLELDESEAAALESVPSLEAALPEVPEEKNTLKEGDSNSQDKTLQQRKNALRANGPLRFLNDPKPNAGVSENSAGSASNGMESELKMDSPAQTDSEFGAGSETEMQLELQDDSPREELGTEETAEKIVEESMEGTGGKGLVSSENGVPEALEMAVPADMKNAAERENAKTDSDAEIEHGTESGLELKADSVPGTDSEAGSGTGFAGSETKPEAEPQMLLNAETDTNQNSNAEVPRGESEEGMLLLDESPEMGTVQDSVSENSGIPQASAQSDEKRVEQMTEQFSEQVAVQVSEQLANQLADSIAEKVVEKTLDEVVRRLKTELELKAAEEADLESENSIQDSVQIGKSEASANAESNESVEETAALSLKEETDASDKAETSDKASRMVQNESGNPAFSGTSNEGKTASEKPTDGQEVDLDAIPEVLVLFDESEETLQANADSAEKTQNETAESGKPAFSQTANSGQAADFGQTAKSSQVANSSQTANSGLTRDSNAKLKEGTSSEAPGFVKLSGRKRKKKGTSAKVSASSEIVPEKTSIRSALTNSSESPKQTNQFAQTDSAPIQGGNLETAGVQAGISGGTGSRIELADPANSISNPFASAMKAKQEQQREIFASLPETLEPQQLMLYPCEGVVLNTESLIKTVYVENAENCDFVELNESQLAIIGKCQGETRVLVQFKEPDVEPQLFKVSVQEGNSNTKILSMWGKELEIQMNQVLANAGMSIFVFQNRIFIKGSLPESIQAEQVMKTVQKDFAQLIKMNPGLEIRGMSSQERKIVVVNLLFQTGLP